MEHYIYSPEEPEEPSDNDKIGLLFVLVAAVFCWYIIINIGALVQGFIDLMN